MTNIAVIKGINYYPVGSWQKHQHKFYNYADVCYNNMNANPTDEAEEQFSIANELIDLFDSLPQRNGIVYAPYEQYKRLKAIIVWYDGKSSFCFGN